VYTRFPVLKLLPATFLKFKNVLICAEFRKKSDLKSKSGSGEKFNFIVLGGYAYNYKVTGSNANS
jgi:hypothetical protein